MLNIVIQGEKMPALAIKNLTSVPVMGCGQVRFLVETEKDLESRRWKLSKIR